jgi:hypothetical protein
MDTGFSRELENTASPFTSPQEELDFLRSQIEKQSQTKERTSSPEAARQEAAQDIVHEYSQAKSPEILHESYVMDEQTHEGIQLKLSPEAHDNIVEDLYALMMEKGVKNALDAVSRMNNPHIEDDFHRFLVQYLAEEHHIPGLKPKTDLAKSLGLRMFEILLPSKGSEDDNNWQNVASLMEQFLAGMQAISHDRSNKDKSYYVLELALDEASDDMVMYVAVPEARGGMFEKQILSLFEDARVTEVYDDYNIFNFSGIVSASYATATDYDVLQMKTYDQFDHDPMKVIMNAFSKLSEKGEGASIQIVVMPQGDSDIESYGKILDGLKKGKTLKESVGDTSLSKGLVKGFGELFTGGSKDEKEKEEDDRVLDEAAIQSVSEKLKSTVVRTNIRIIGSAATKQRSDDIVHELGSAFQQFSDTQGNGLHFHPAKGREIESLVHQFIFRMYNTDHLFRLNLKELATIYHFPLGASGFSQLKQTNAKSAPAPGGVPTDGIILGKNSYRHKETMVHMSPADRLRHFYVIGQTGTGKTHLLKSMIIQDIKNGEGVCFIDPHGSDINDILNHIPKDRVDDVIYFNPAHTDHPMGLNMLEYDTRYPEQKSFVINEMMSIFNKLFDMKVGGGAMFEQYFRNSAGLVMEHPESGNTLLEIGRVLADPEFRKMKLNHCNNPIIKQFWKNAEQTTGEQGLENFVPYITSKFDSFISNEIMRPVVAQQHSSFNFRDIMDSRKILLVDLSKGRLGEINANLIGLVLVGKILMAALSRVDSMHKELPPFYLYIDEFQNVTTDSISQILSEARKYGLGLHIAHQYISQLDEGIKNAVFGNVGSMATFRVSSEDASYLEKRFAPTFSADDIMKIENRNAYVQMLGHGKPLTPFNIMTLPLGPENPAHLAEKIKQLSYLKYGRPRAEVEADISRRYV